MKHGVYIALIFLLVYSSNHAQFSPGKLMKAHANLEGSKNCTKCHDIGKKVTNNKCLDCHKEIKTLTTQKKGYHGHSSVVGKTCVTCHSDHHGLNFDALHFDPKGFDHTKTGYKLEGKHSAVDCKECHKSSNIKDSQLKKRSGTYLGLTDKCISCHTDYHQGTLSTSCLNCHTMEDFKKAPKFDHQKAKFQLKGAHVKVDCIKCHQKTTRNEKEFQIFKGVKFANCTDCHKDHHNGSFGNNCLKCHNINSWTNVNLSEGFNHNTTHFPLVGKHKNVSCNECHVGGNFTRPMKHGECMDCHKDYHNGELKLVSETFTDCKRCHNLEMGFQQSNFQLADHEKSKFPLRGAHVATPCFSCHKETPDVRWTFRFKSQNCIECHDNIHQDKISESFMGEKSCQSCHSVNTWSEINFDHSKTNYKLKGKHSQINCRSCHFQENKEGQTGIVQKFKGLNTECYACHDHNHGDQFTQNGVTECKKCHNSNSSWTIPSFDHEKTNFPLEGGHTNVACSECHKPVKTSTGKTIIQYKLKSYQCIDCHY